MDLIKAETKDLIEELIENKQETKNCDYKESLTYNLILQ